MQTSWALISTVALATTACVALPASQFAPCGPGAGDATAPTGDDHKEIVLALPLGHRIRVFDSEASNTSITTAHITSNGVISNAPFSGYVASLSSAWAQTLIGVLWADLDTRNRTLSPPAAAANPPGNRIYGRLETSAAAVAALLGPATCASDAVGRGDFAAIGAVVATWWFVGAFDSVNENPATAQAIIAYDADGDSVAVLRYDVPAAYKRNTGVAVIAGKGRGSTCTVHSNMSNPSLTIGQHCSRVGIGRENRHGGWVPSTFASLSQVRQLDDAVSRPGEIVLPLTARAAEYVFQGRCRPTQTVTETEGSASRSVSDDPSSTPSGSTSATNSATMSRSTTIELQTTLSYSRSATLTIVGSKSASLALTATANSNTASVSFPPSSPTLSIKNTHTATVSRTIHAQSRTRTIASSVTTSATPTSSNVNTLSNGPISSTRTTLLTGTVSVTKRTVSEEVTESVKRSASKSEPLRPESVVAPVKAVFTTVAEITSATAAVVAPFTAGGAIRASLGLGAMSCKETGDPWPRLLDPLQQASETPSLFRRFAPALRSDIGLLAGNAVLSVAAIFAAAIFGALMITFPKVSDTFPGRGERAAVMADHCAWVREYDKRMQDRSPDNGASEETAAWEPQQSRLKDGEGGEPGGFLASLQVPLMPPNLVETGSGVDSHGSNNHRSTQDGRVGGSPAARASRASAFAAAVNRHVGLFAFLTMQCGGAFVAGLLMSLLLLPSVASTVNLAVRVSFTDQALQSVQTDLTRGQMSEAEAHTYRQSNPFAQRVAFAGFCTTVVIGMTVLFLTAIGRRVLTGRRHTEKALSSAQWRNDVYHSRARDDPRRNGNGRDGKSAEALQRFGVPGARRSTQAARVHAGDAHGSATADGFGEEGGFVEMAVMPQQPIAVHPPSAIVLLPPTLRSPPQDFDDGDEPDEVRSPLACVDKGAAGSVEEDSDSPAFVSATSVETASHPTSFAGPNQPSRGRQWEGAFVHFNDFEDTIGKESDVPCSGFMMPPAAAPSQGTFDPFVIITPPPQDEGTDDPLGILFTPPPQPFLFTPTFGSMVRTESFASAASAPEVGDPVGLLASDAQIDDVLLAMLGPRAGSRRSCNANRPPVGSHEQVDGTVSFVPSPDDDDDYVTDVFGRVSIGPNNALESPPTSPFRPIHRRVGTRCAPDGANARQEEEEEEESSHGSLPRQEGRAACCRCIASQLTGDGEWTPAPGSTALGLGAFLLWETLAGDGRAPSQPGVSLSDGGRSLSAMQPSSPQNDDGGTDNADFDDLPAPHRATTAERICDSSGDFTEPESIDDADEQIDPTPSHVAISVHPFVPCPAPCTTRSFCCFRLCGWMPWAVVRRRGASWIPVLELSMTLASGAAVGLSRAGFCTAGPWLALASQFVYTVVLVVAWPLRSPLLQIVASATALLQLAALTVDMVLFSIHDTSNDTDGVKNIEAATVAVQDVGEYLQLVVLAFATLQGIAATAVRVLIAWRRTGVSSVVQQRHDQRRQDEEQQDQRHERQRRDQLQQRFTSHGADATRRFDPLGAQRAFSNLSFDTVNVGGANGQDEVDEGDNTYPADTTHLHEDRSVLMPQFSFFESMPEGRREANGAPPTMLGDEGDSSIQRAADAVFDQHTSERDVDECSRTTSELVGVQARGPMYGLSLANGDASGGTVLQRVQSGHGSGLNDL